MGIRLGAPLVLGLTLALGPAVARPDVFPEGELYGDAIAASVEIYGLARFPEHVFYLFPLRCSRALVGLDEDEGFLGLEDLKVEDGVDDLPNYAALRDGPIAAWIGPGGPCQASAVYAMDREAAAGVDLATMPLAAQQTFFADDPRLFRSDFKFDTRRPELPFRPMKPRDGGSRRATRRGPSGATRGAAGRCADSNGYSGAARDRHYSGAAHDCHFGADCHSGADARGARKGDDTGPGRCNGRRQCNGRGRPDRRARAGAAPASRVAPGDRADRGPGRRDRAASPLAVCSDPAPSPQTGPP